MLHTIRNCVKRTRFSGTRLRITVAISLLALILLCGGAWLTAGYSQNRSGSLASPRSTNGGQTNVNQGPTNVNSGQVNTDTRQRTVSIPLPTGETAEDQSPFHTEIRKRAIKLEGTCSLDDPVAQRIVADYGAIFVATESIMPPPVCMFQSDAEVLAFQNAAKFGVATIGGTTINLQSKALLELLEARNEAREAGLDITPRGGSEAARRSYSATLRLWNSRFNPALAHWQQRGRISREQAARLRVLPIYEQVREVLNLEKSSIYFSTGFDKSILYSVAAPGTSQHISMLALDVAQFANPRVRKIMAKHGWFQTVKSDMPHFTYLGLDEAQLSSHGLKSVVVGSQIFWVPNLDDPKGAQN